MDQSLYGQITSLIEKSQKILVLAHARVDCDGIGAALAASLVFKEMGKEVTVATNDPTPENLAFLPSIDSVKNSLANSKDFIITVDTSKTPVGKIKYNIEGDKVNIIITPKEGSFGQSDVSFGQDTNKYDLILVLDTGNLEHLGSIYDQNVEMFYETPIINIDHHVSNTDFGQVNIVDVNASSATEILFDYLQYLEKRYNKKFITEDIATLLLGGIITDTGSFQHANTSPRAMESSAKLLDLGARQQEIIKNIYKTKKLSTLKLWGIILSKVQVDPVHRMVWSAISKDDFQEAEAEAEETEGIIDDLLTNAPGAEVIFLIKENTEYISTSMRSTNNQTDVGKFCADNGGGGHVRAAGFKLRTNEPFEMTVSDVVGRVRKFQAERLNIHKPDNNSIVNPVGNPIIESNANKPNTQLEHNLNTIGTRDQREQNNATKEQENNRNTIGTQSEKVTYLDFKAPKTEPLPSFTKPSSTEATEVSVTEPRPTEPPKPNNLKTEKPSRPTPDHPPVPKPPMPAPPVEPV